MNLCLFLFLTGCQVTYTSAPRLPAWGPHPLRASYIENVFRLGFPLVAQTKLDGGYRSVLELQVGARFGLTGFKLDLETVEAGIFARF